MGVGGNFMGQRVACKIEEYTVLSLQRNTRVLIKIFSNLESGDAKAGLLFFSSYKKEQNNGLKCIKAS